MIFVTVVFVIFTIIMYTFIFCCIESIINKSDSITVTPWTLKDCTELNWFGCWICAIVIRILNPIWSILYFCYWITHI